MLIYRDARLTRKHLFIESTQTTIPLSLHIWNAIWRHTLVIFFVGGVYWLRKLGLRKPGTTVGFYPCQPKPWYKIWSITKYLGLKHSEDLSACDVLVYFEDKSYAKLDTDFIGLPGKTVLNALAHDIRKDRVTRIFEEVFGYSLAVDPTTHEGPAVCKSLENGAHDGRIVLCPLEAAEPGFIYQLLIQNSYDGEKVQDIRVPIIGERIPFVYIKERPVGERFANDNTRISLRRPEEALTDREIGRLMVMARRMGVDLGDFDVLRDRADGRVYVVDVNKTCLGPPIALPFADKVWAVHLLSEAFRELIERR